MLSILNRLYSQGKELHTMANKMRSFTIANRRFGYITNIF